MAAVSTENLVKGLNQSKVLGPAQLREVQALLRRHRDPRVLARELVERKLLTVYQVNQLLQGAGRDLVLGPYIILQRLGDNALGQVYKARHQHMNRLVSLTVVREDLLAQPEAVSQFYQEVQLVSQLTHPHLVCAYDAGPIGKSHFFAQEYVEGIDLERLVEQFGPLPVGPAVNFIRQTALGLQHAWERKLLHHDLRPINLLVTRFPGQSDPARGKDMTPQPTAEQMKDTLIKVCNLGLTMLQPRPRQGAAVSTDGIYDFAAPETAQAGQLLDVRSNLYNLGAIFYYTLAGRLPFPGGNSSIKLRKHQVEEAVPLSSARPDVPAHIEEVIRKLMAKRPDDRFQTPSELADALGAGTDLYPTASARSDQTAVKQASRVLPKSAAPAAPAPAEPAPAEPGLSQRLRGPAGLAIGGGLLMLAVGVGVWLLNSSDDPARTEPTTASATPTALQYVRKGNRTETVLATLAANGMPTFKGRWYYIGPFDNPGSLEGFDRVYPPQTEIDLKKTYEGKGKKRVGWKELPGFEPGQVFSLKVIPDHNQACVYLYHEFEAGKPTTMVVGFGSDDSLQVWFNGRQVVSAKSSRAAVPDTDLATLEVRQGRNQMLVKVCNGSGDFAFYLMPRWPLVLEKLFISSLDRDFPK